MTDTTTALATIQEKVAALAAPDATLADIGNNLGYLWDQAAKTGDEIAQQYLAVAWERTQALATNTSAANAVATAALETAVQIAEQHAELVTALAHRDGDHELVREVLDEMEQDLIEMIYSGCEYGAIHSDNPGEAAVESGRWGDMQPEDLEDFMHILLGDSDELPTEMYESFAEYINLMLPAARQYWAESRPEWAKVAPRQRFTAYATSNDEEYIDAVIARREAAAEAADDEKPAGGHQKAS